MQKFISRRHFLKYLLSNGSLLIIGNVTFAGQLQCFSSNTCPQCHFPCDSIKRNIIFESMMEIGSYCPNCGINLLTQKHDIKCDQYFKCRQEKQQDRKKNQTDQNECTVCWNIPFLAKETIPFNEKPMINLCDLKF
jgi:hypothetical protein